MSFPRVITAALPPAVVSHVSDLPLFTLYFSFSWGIVKNKKSLNYFLCLNNWGPHLYIYIYIYIYNGNSPSSWLSLSPSLSTYIDGEFFLYDDATCFIFDGKGLSDMLKIEEWNNGVTRVTQALYEKCWYYICIYIYNVYMNVCKYVCMLWVSWFYI